MAGIVRVDLGARAYEIRIGRGLLPEVGTWCRKAGLGASALVVTDANVARHHLAPVAESLAAASIRATAATIPPGESSKDLQHLAGLYVHAVEAGLDRASFVVALGGGVVGDLAGFLAATYLRGIRLAQVPTSLLAMVDSSVGGKTGIDLPQGKNLVGAFHQPSAVIADTDTLRTLPPREYRAGLAEVVKYGVIADADFFARLEREADAVAAGEAAVLEAVVERCCRLKAEVVAADEREGGRRAILNYGHTLAHAIEHAVGYGEWRHGEAVAAGMVFAARLSTAEAGLPEADADRLVALLRRLGLPVVPPDVPWEAVRRAMAVDKKAVGRVPRFVLAGAIGRARPGVEVPEGRLREVWDVCRQ